MANEIVNWKDKNEACIVLSALLNRTILPSNISSIEPSILSGRVDNLSFPENTFFQRRHETGTYIVYIGHFQFKSGAGSTIIFYLNGIEHFSWDNGTFNFPIHVVFNTIICTGGTTWLDYNFKGVKVVFKNNMPHVPTITYAESDLPVM